MPVHDIIDNRSEKLLDHVNGILASADAARMAVGYFFLSGFIPLARRLADVRDIRLLIGNATNRETVEQMAEGYRRLELVRNRLETEQYPKRQLLKEMTSDAAAAVRDEMALMDQTDDAEALAACLVRLIEEKRLKVRIYTRGRLHAKAYIFDYGPIYDDAGRQVPREEQGIAIVGSSNLTLCGITHNTELNILVSGNANHEALTKWFDELWNEGQEFDEALMTEIRQSWAMAPVSPWDIYLKTLYTLVKDRLEDEEQERDPLWKDELWTDLTEFQREAVRRAVRMIRLYGGAFIADVVGLGKSYMGAAVLKHFERGHRCRPLIICPASLEDMWKGYDEKYHLNAAVLSMGMLREDDRGIDLLDSDNGFYHDRDFVLLDESHNFRYSNTQRYQLLEQFLVGGKRCCFLTATPRNKTAWDVYHQIRLFHQDDRTDMPIDPPDLKQYFEHIERGERKLQDLLSHILIRRRRNDILRWYGYDVDTGKPIDQSRFDEYRLGRRRAYILVNGKRQFFPKRNLVTVEYSIEDAYQGLYQRLRRYIGTSSGVSQRRLPPDELTYARYGLWHYVKPGRQRIEPYVSLQRAGATLRGLMHVLLFKRFESSVFAFTETLRRLISVHDGFLAALFQGIVPAGEEAQAILYASDETEEAALTEALRAVSERYAAEDFDCPSLEEALRHDVELLREMLSLVEPITPTQDAKLQVLQEMLGRDPLRGQKALIFTQYADTARYLHENLNPGHARADVGVVYSNEHDKTRAVGRFAPRANPSYRFRRDDVELSILIATDVLAEGLNLQDCNNIINYDLHWSPVRLIQRFGRIDRIGSEHDTINAYNFLPETGIEKQLGLRDRLHRRIQEIQDTIGEDSKILDESEQVNEEAMYAIYGQDSDKLSLYEEDEGDLADLNEAEEFLRRLRRDDPAEFARIAGLRDGIRTRMPSASDGLYVFCRAGRFHQLFLVDEEGRVTTRDVPSILRAVRCTSETEGARVPPGFNAAAMRVRALFAEEVHRREAERRHVTRLTRVQQYVHRALRAAYDCVDDERTRHEISELERAFCGGSVSPAVGRDLNVIKRNALTGDELLSELTAAYHRHNMAERVEHRQRTGEEEAVPVLVCSEWLG